jgi:hypothetical protein
MTLSTQTPESILTKTFQASLLVAMPVTVYALGGPVAIWTEGGIIAKTILAANILPTVICAPAAIESLVRTGSLSLKYINAEPNSDMQLAQKDVLKQEIRRTTGMARAALFPISGWAVVVQLPVKDYYVYTIPKQALKTAGSAVGKGARAVNEVLKAIKFWDVAKITLDYAVIPVFEHAVIPVCNGIASAASAALRLLSASLGVR